MNNDADAVHYTSYFLTRQLLSIDITETAIKKDGKKCMMMKLVQ